MPCSAVTLSLATIAAVVSVALLAIAFSTDNWLMISVERSQLQPAYTGQNSTKSREDREKFTHSPVYFTRTRGLFRVCFPTDRPDGVNLYMSPVETYCYNIDYYIPDRANGTSQFSDDKMAWLHMGRATIALFLVAFFFVFIAFWTGVAGCWRRSPGNITATAILMLLACLLSAGAMGLWHGVQYYENDRLNDDEFPKKWAADLREHSFTTYDWSYIVAWIGVSWSLVAAILFSGAAICLRSERRQEEAMNVQYLMPVYPQKQQYAYGYAYPGPYHYGSQYGPYNY